MVIFTVWVITYAPTPMWLCDEVSDSHGSQHMADDSFPSLVTRGPRDFCMGFVLDLQMPGGTVCIIHRDLI
jgi:hypothetical protein